mgnify:FL=1
MILVVVAPRRAVAEFERVAFAFAESVAAWQHSSRKKFAALPRQTSSPAIAAAAAAAVAAAKAEAAAAPTLADAARGKAQRVPDSPSSAKPAAVIQTVRGFADTVFVPC